MRKKHILVVDNEQHMANGIKFILSLENHNVATAKDGKEALYKVLLERENKIVFDLLITDIWMPELTGLDMLKELEKLKIRIPTLIITAMENKAIKEELLDLGYIHFMNKPFDDNELIKKVENMFHITPSKKVRIK